MTDGEKLLKLRKLADAMYYAAQQLTTDASRLHKAMEDYHQFIVNDYHEEDPVNKQSVYEAMAEVEEKAKAFTEAHKGESSEQLLAEMRGEEPVSEDLEEAIAWLEKQVEQPAWREEDETRLTNIIIMLKEGASLHFNKTDITKAVDFLKSLRPQNSVTDEELEKIVDETCSLIDTLASGYGKKITEPITFSGVRIIAGIKERLRILVKK